MSWVVDPSRVRQLSIHVIPQLLAGKSCSGRKPLTFRCGTGVSPVERHGQDAHATAYRDEAFLLFLSAPLPPLGGVEGGLALIPFIGSHTHIRYCIPSPRALSFPWESFYLGELAFRLTARLSSGCRGCRLSAGRTPAGGMETIARGAGSREKGLAFSYSNDDRGVGGDAETPDATGSHENPGQQAAPRRSWGRFLSRNYGRPESNVNVSRIKLSSPTRREMDLNALVHKSGDVFSRQDSRVDVIL